MTSSITIKLPFIKKTMHVLGRLDDERDEYQWGLTNRCADGQYVLFLDYDQTPIDWIVEEVLLLQRRKEWLGEAHIFKTTKGYHVVFLEKNTLDEVYDAMRLTSCDTQYRDIPMRYARRAWVLRQSDKAGKDIEYHDTIPAASIPTSLHERSTAHAEYLKDRYPLPDTNWSGLVRYDHEYELRLAYYKTGDHNRTDGD